jgi:hypothetical protein
MVKVNMTGSTCPAKPTGSNTKMFFYLLGSYAPPCPFGQKTMPIAYVTVTLTNGSSRGKFLTKKFPTQNQ